MHLLVDEDTLGCAAHLARAEEAAEHGALCGARQVGIVTDDHGAVSARFDQGALEAGGTHDLLRRPV